MVAEPQLSMAANGLRLVLASVAQRYRLRVVPNHPIELQPLVTLRPRYGVKVTLERRGN